MFIEKAYGQVLWFYGQEDVYVSCETQFQPSYLDAIFTCHKNVQTLVLVGRLKFHWVDIMKPIT